MALNNREFKLAIAVLGRVPLKRVLVRPTNAGHFHLDQDATGRRVG